MVAVSNGTAVGLSDALSHSTCIVAIAEGECKKRRSTGRGEIWKGLKNKKKNKEEEVNESTNK